MSKYFMYNKRSCLTGRELFEKLKEKERGWRRCNRNEPRRAPQVLIRWGNGIHPDPENALILNTREAINNATDKGAMLDLFREHDVPTPRSVKITNTGRESFTELLDADGYLYIRDKNDHVRYAHVSGVKGSDKYALTPIDKVREFRVHVFNDRTIGVYEKVPQSEDVRIYKDNNCDFVRLDRSSKTQMRPIRGVRPAARAAVSACGLLFGGVDVMLDEDGNVYVLEVNTAPALNSLNLDRWANTMLEYISENS